MHGENKVIALFVVISIAALGSMALMQQISDDIALIAVMSIVAVFLAVHIWYRPPTNSEDKEKSFFSIVTFFFFLFFMLDEIVEEVLGNEALLAFPMAVLAGVGLTLVYEKWDKRPEWLGKYEAVMCLLLLLNAVSSAATGIRPWWMAPIIVLLPVTALFLGRQWYFYQRWLRRAK
jgi:hypothetical protein